MELSKNSELIHRANEMLLNEPGLTNSAYKMIKELMERLKENGIQK